MTKKKTIKEAEAAEKHAKITRDPQKSPLVAVLGAILSLFGKNKNGPIR